MSNGKKYLSVHLLYHQLVLRWNHGPTNGIKVNVKGLSRGSVIVRGGLLGGPQFDSLQLL